MSESDSGSYESGSEIMNESEAYSSANEEMPESLAQVFAEKEEKRGLNQSVFTKNRGEQTNTENVRDEKMRKANAVFDNLNIFKDC